MTIAPQDFLVTQALFALDAILPPWPHKVQLFVVGGYALQLAGVRKDPTEATDVDYIGQTFTGETRAAIDEIGLRFGLGKGWLNNDLLLVGSESGSTPSARRNEIRHHVSPQKPQPDRGHQPSPREVSLTPQFGIVQKCVTGRTVVLINVPSACLRLQHL